MHFCPTCSNLLLVEPSAGGMRFFCQTCPYLYRITEKFDRKIPLQRKQIDDVLGGDSAWENVDQTETRCPHCNHTRAYFMQIQIRSADEPSTTFYKCDMAKEFSSSFSCFSLACHDLPRAEIGDKVVLPPSVLAEITRRKIPLPLAFQLQNATLPTPKDQFGGVLEFSAAEGIMFAPYWMMQNLLVEEGGQVKITTALNIPKGISCQLQPHSIEFLDLAANVGPKELLEASFRHYSVLNVGETILIEYAKHRYFLEVVQAKPASVISLCGHLDLQIDFLPPAHLSHRRPRTARQREEEREKEKEQQEVYAKQQQHLQELKPEELLKESKNDKPVAATELQYGRRLSDGAYMCEENSEQAVKSRTPSLSFQKALKQVKNDSRGSCKEQKAFATIGNVLGIKEEVPEQQKIPSLYQESERDQATTAALNPGECEFCLETIPMTNMELHQLRCQKNTKYHKIRCQECPSKILLSEALLHQHCAQCVFVGSEQEVEIHTNAQHRTLQCQNCPTFVQASEMSDHLENHCDKRLEKCNICHLKFEHQGFDQHYKQCSSRTELCEICQKYISITEIERHEQECCDVANATPVQSLPSGIQKHECLYCDETFVTAFLMKSHVQQTCVIARQFQDPEIPKDNIRCGKIRAKSNASISSKSFSEFSRKPVRQPRKPLSNNLNPVIAPNRSTKAIQRPKASSRNSTKSKSPASNPPLRMGVTANGLETHSNEFSVTSKSVSLQATKQHRTKQVLHQMNARQRKFSRKPV